MRAAMVADAPGELPSSVDIADALRNYEKQGVVDTSKAETELGFRPTPIAEWMDETVRWHAPLLS